MIPLLITFVSIASYFTIGFTWSRRMLPKWWKIARREWHNETSVRQSVKDQWLFKALAWPWFVCIDLDKLIDSGDPCELEARLKDRDQRIEELERELGMK